jgi:predicted permease
MRIRLKQSRLVELIAKSNLSQNHWAIKLGLSRGHWSDIVNGKHPYPSVRTRERLLEIFGIPFDELFETEGGGWSDQSFEKAMSERYLIDRELGQGGMGTVYLARDFKLGRVVALKVVSPEAVSGIGVQQFLKEIRYTARLEHHHILPLYDAGEAAGYPYYVMPYVRDGSLRDLLDRKQRLSLDETLEISRGVAGALTHAHEQQVLHCDVKPANVLLSGTHAYVADFGISRAIHRESLEWGRPAGLDTSAGTPAYVSPEQASGEQQLDGRSDVYSLACMVFEMLSGRKPFQGETTMAVVSQRFTSEPPDLRELLPEVPSRVSKAVQRGMAMDLERRQDDAAAFVESVQRGATHRAPGVRETLGILQARLGALVRRALRRPEGSGELVTGAQRLRNRGRRMLGSIRQDLTFALRSFARTPVFAAVVVLTLGFGIAANTLVFSLMNPYFFRALPFNDAEQLVQLGQIDQVRGWDGVRFSLPQLRDYKERSRAFQDLAAYGYTSRNLTGLDQPERILAGFLTANMFSVLGAAPALGRTFLPDEDSPGALPVAVLDHGLWQRRFGGDPEMLGRTVTLNGVSHTVVGIMPQDFVFPFGGIDVWVPLRADSARMDRHRMSYLIVGRLKSDWSIDRARNELQGVHAALGEVYPEADGLFQGISVKPIRRALNFAWEILQMTFLLLLVAVGFALVIACVNVASLMLARASARTGEVAVRTALGAGRKRLVRQFLTEGALLAVAGAGLGLLLARWGAGLLWPVIPEDWFRVGDATIDGKVLLFTLGVTAVTVLLFGLAPAFAATRSDLSTALKEGGRAGFGMRSVRMRRALVVCEVALAVLMISGVGLAGRSLLAVQRIDLGFQSDPVLVAVASPPALDYPEREDVERYYELAVTELEALPGVRAVGAAAHIPQNHEEPLDVFARAGQEPANLEDWPVGLFNSAMPGYFAAMGIPILAGRDFGTVDRPDAPHVVIVSERLAREQYPGESAVGQTIVIGDPRERTTATIIGVVGDVRFEGLTGPVHGGTEHPQVYQPLSQGGGRRRFMVLQGTGDPASLTNSVRQTLLRVDRNLPVSIFTMESIIAQNALPWSMSTILLGVLGAAALLLASLGIYGVMAYSVVQRRREIGVRMAMGASQSVIRKTFIGEGLRLSAIGIVLALVASNLLRAALYGVRSFDPVTFGGVLVLFLGVAVVASLLPAIRASRVDPITALRYE